MELVFRTELLQDYDEVFELHTKAFGRKNESKMVERLRKIPQFIPELSIVAENEDGEIVGHVLFTPVIIRSSQQNFPSLVLSPIGVLPKWQGKGVARQLLNYGMELCAELGYSSVIVFEQAPFYTKFGFKAAEQWNIQSPVKVATNHFMVRELRRNALKNVSGTVEYPKSFAAS
jgi:putative acetyltransferase